MVDGVAYFLRAVDLRPGVQDIPSLLVSIRAPWLELPLSDFVNSMNTNYQGVLNGIFRQMPIAAWFRAQCLRIQLTVALPSPLPLGEWQATLLRRTSCWPHRLPQDQPELRPPSKATFIRLRKRGQFKHILGGLVVTGISFATTYGLKDLPSSLEKLTRRLFLLRPAPRLKLFIEENDPDKWNPWKQHCRLVCVKTTHERCGPFSLCRLEPNVSHKVCS